MSKRRAPRGFTVVELIVVLTQLLLLASWTLPAILNVRETRLQCRGNFHQLGLALRNYQHALGVLPPGCVNPTRPIRNQVEGYHFGWMTQILPMLQRTDVWNRLDDGRSDYDQVNLPATTAAITEYRCPSYRPTKGMSESHYGGVQHAVEAPVDVDQNGVLFLNSAVRDEDISDGLPHTALAGECDLATAPLGYASGTQATLRNGGSPPGSAFDTFAELPQWPTILQPGDPEVVTASPPQVGARFSSCHPGVVQFVLGDGSVRCISLLIDQEDYRRRLNRREAGLGWRFEFGRIPLRCPVGFLLVPEGATAKKICTIHPQGRS